MKNRITSKNFAKLFLLCSAAALCACGIAACTRQTETVDVTVEQLVEANDRQAVIDKYGDLHIKETSEYDTGATYNADVMFYANEYGLIMDYYYAKTDGSSAYSCTFINGMLYSYESSGDSVRYMASLLGDGDYNVTVSSYYNLEPSEVTKGPELKDGKIVVEAEDSYEPLGYCETKTFYYNAETLLLEKMTSVFTLDNEYFEGWTNTEAIYEYGCSDYVPALTAYNAHRNAEDKTNFIVVRNAGTEDENRREYEISQSGKLYLSNREGTNYCLFADADCTEEVSDYRDYIQDGYVPVFYLTEKTLPTLKELLEANDVVTVVNKYGNLHLSYTYESEGVEYSVICHYSRNDYGMVYDLEWKSADGEICSSETVMNGVIYGYDSEDKTTGEPEGLYFNIVAADNYNKFFSNFYKNMMFGENISGKIYLSDGKIVLAEYVEGQDKTVYYYFNADTLLLESYKDGDFEDKVTYGGEYTPPRRAYNKHQSAEDKKEITIIQYPGTDNEQRTTCTVSVSSGVCLYYKNRDEYALYENVSCTNEIEDVTQFIEDNTYPTLYVGQKRTEAISFEYTYTQADYDEFECLLSDFEAAAMNEDESMSSVQIAYDYMWDKYMYIDAQSLIARAIYDQDNTDSKWSDYVTAYKAYLQAIDDINATYKNLYEADVAYNDLLFKGWSEEDIAKLTGITDENSQRISQLTLENQDIQRAVSGMYGNYSTFMEEAGKLYSQLVANNQEIAKLRGYDNYYQYAQKAVYSRDWNEAEIENFSAYVKEYLVPLYSQISRRVTDITLTEEQLKQAEIIVGNLVYSQLETDYVSMYFNSFGGTLGEHFNSLFDKGLALFAEGDNGSATAYTDYMEYYGTPYCVFGSGNYYQSVNAVIHESGHYVSAYNYSFIETSYDLLETHSQGNEFLFLAFMKDYLDEEVYEYCVLSKIESVLNRIIQMSVINEFEYTVYSAVDTPYTVEDYADILDTLCDEYGISDGVTNAFSQYTIYVSCANPCYYISYGVSLVPTIDLFIKAQENYKVAQECYRILQEDAAKEDGFKAALALAGIGSPFDESTFLNIKEAFDIDAVMYNDAVQDALLAEESEIRDLVTLTEEDERVTWNEDGKVLLLTFHKYPGSYVEGETSVTGSWYMWTVTDGEIIDWYAENQYNSTVFADKLKQVLGMPISSTNTYISAVWVDVNNVIRPAYQTDPTAQLTAADLDGSSLGIYEEWFNANIISSYCSTWGQYPWTRLGYTYNWDSEDVYGLSEFVILPGSEITVEFTKTIDEFVVWLYNQSAAGEANQAA
ncbi:MAG: hypothetical protein ACI4VK_02135 [Candidatus Coproplasma sp.]